MSTLPGRLNPITTGRLAGGLLAAARPIGTTFDNWRQGVTFTPNCSATHGLAGCVDPTPTPDDKDIDPVSAPAVFEPFVVHQGRDCSTWIDTNDLLDLARRGLEATISGSFAIQLQSAPIGTNPSLNSEATDITPGGGPVNVVNTLSGLVSAACECGINDLVFHANLRILPFLLQNRLVEWDDSEKVWKMGPWPFVLDCYEPTGPGAVVENPDGSEAWIYVSGPIEVETAPEMDIDEIDERQNYQIALTERLSILRFDPCCVQAALACLGSGTC